MAASYLLHAPFLREAGVGALLTCLCDAGGSNAQRAPALLAFGLLGALLIAGFGLLRPLGFAVIPLACLGIAVFSLLRVYGQSAQQVGSLLSVVLVLAQDRALPGLRAALLLGGGFLGGSLWALLLTLVIWRLHPNRPGRQAVARVYLALADLCADLASLCAADGGTAVARPTDQLWTSHTRLHRRMVRDLIEQARTAASARLRARGAPGHPARLNLLRIDSADALFRALIALTDLLEPGAEGDGMPADAAPFAAGLAEVLRGVAPYIVSGRDEGLVAAGAAIARLSAIVRASADGPIRRIGQTVVDRLWDTLNMGAPAADTPVVAASLKAPALLQPLLDNLSWQSAALRHAARAALVCALGFGITFAAARGGNGGGSYQHWLTITMVLTLQPYYAPTLQRALERIGGTVLGGLAAAAISVVCHTPLAIAAAIFPLSVLALSLRAVNFGLYVAALTPVIVLLVELGAPAHGAAAIPLMRAAYTLAGGALAVLGCIFLWPSWEPDRLDRELRVTAGRHAAFAAVTLDLLAGRATLAQADAARRAAGMASNNLEASLGRALLEPRQGRHDRLEAALAAGAALRRVGGRLTAMVVLAPAQVTTPDPALPAWRDWVASVAAGLEQVPPLAPPAAPDLASDPVLAESLARLAAQFALCSQALRRHAQPPDGEGDPGGATEFGPRAG